ncbi:phospholipid transport system substrate-binding protein [Marinospirillum celere]|uniref:Phospholipid transport system substrate-binding protein n=1 Tax=Marinospirillum celere TaxID=1122252 RepID=A0A1I1FXH9_9GAMM|nr:ABC transporter substrate-binding protein [Marinospirillum celere]SFC04044.1 phospholipid transport system substrate-binding protein [Marinospirillum celere]
MFKPAYLLLLLCFLVVPAQAGTSASHQVVEAGIEALTKAFEENRGSFEEDPDILYKALSDAMEPYVDFRYISARVMGGRYFRAASPEQRSRFARVFQKTLVRTFGQGLMNFDYREFDLQFRETASRHEDQDNVELEVVAQDGQRYPVVFTLRKSNDEWKVINLIVNGVNLGLTFNSQFDRAMREHRRDFDRVIDQWSPDAALEEIQEEAES